MRNVIEVGSKKIHVFSRPIPNRRLLIVLPMVEDFNMTAACIRIQRNYILIHKGCWCRRAHQKCATLPKCTKCTKIHQMYPNAPKCTNCTQDTPIHFAKMHQMYQMSCALHLWQIERRFVQIGTSAGWEKVDNPTKWLLLQRASCLKTIILKSTGYSNWWF